MRISYILDTFGGGGKERRCLQLIQGLNEFGYDDIQVIIINNDVAYQELYNTTASVNIIDRKTKGLSFFATCSRVKKLIKEFNPDIVQTWGGLSTLIPCLLKPFYGYTLIGAYVADADGPAKISLDSVYPKVCDKVVGNSQVGLNAYRIPHSKAVLIYNGFNEKRFENKIEKEVKKQSLRIDTPYIVAMIASFWSNKDWACYLNAAKNIVAKRKDITFLAIGDGPTRDANNQLVTSEERNNIQFLGRRSDIDEILQVCDATVLTSLHGEGVSNSILESMAWGVPVIATNSGGTPEIIEDGFNGILLDKNDADILSSKIESILDDTPKRREICVQANNTVCSRFLLKKMTENYVKLYQSFIRK